MNLIKTSFFITLLCCTLFAFDIVKTVAADDSSSKLTNESAISKDSKENTVLEAIKNRRSVRKYKTEQIQDNELKQILEAAKYAPNPGNTQEWHFTVIQKKQVIDKLAELLKENAMKNENKGIKAKIANLNHALYHAPTIILISYKKDAFAAAQTCGAAAENVALAAESLRIGSCVMASSLFIFTPENEESLKKELGIPEGYTLFCSVALGYKDEEPQTPGREDKINFIK